MSTTLKISKIDALEVPERDSKEKSQGEFEDEVYSIPFSVWAGLEPVVRPLLDSGEAVDSRGQRVSTPLLLAALMGQEEVVQLLLDRGAAVDSRARTCKMPPMAAVMSCDEVVCQILLVSGAREDLNDAKGRNAIEILTLELEFDDKGDGESMLSWLSGSKYATSTASGESCKPFWYESMSQDVKVTANRMKLPVLGGMFYDDGPF
ncbi:hypothetical protein N7454_006297 [Penicillium verhagenii]|nr:hypothetical protein N7454_006297 [Penicillium verhagenii]